MFIPIIENPFLCLESDPTTTNKSSIDDGPRPTSLDERISSILGVPATLSSNSEILLETRPTLSAPTIAIANDKASTNPQDIKAVIPATMRNERDHLSLTEKLPTIEGRRSSTSKHYTTEWLASQKPEEAPTGQSDLLLLPWPHST